ncbi:MAG TPA: peptidoglycan-binding protein LysM [Parvularcula sp.]|nr:peptidoglycan-binding protein LysM [Parvularcula sp.]HBS30867.1 peptidoglycan-binding protein LysM [Parvularcula sp.]HBS36591.1 peptidoglycan-binding protein LysM [Parvularcula sp.]
MRVVIIFILLVILGFIAWKAAERFNLVEPAPAVEERAAPAAPDATQAPSLPNFDIVRVDRSGDAVIAGRASPGAAVTVYANEAALATATAGADGAWVMTTETPLSAGAVELSLEMKTADGVVIRSEETIVIYVPEREGDRPLVLKTTPGGATQVLQEPRDAGVGLGPLSLDTIDYDDSGAVIFSGNAEAGRVVQIFAGGQFVGQTAAGDDGRWRLTASMPPGVYSLQIIQLDEGGKPTYAIELPFERASLDDVELKDGRVIVQPGNSLWRIARRVYGKGVQYTVIYEANADQIRDPDLIYPGQIFEVPEGEAAPE